MHFTLNLIPFILKILMLF